MYPPNQNDNDNHAHTAAIISGDADITVVDAYSVCDLYNSADTISALAEDLVVVATVSDNTGAVIAANDERFVGGWREHVLAASNFLGHHYRNFLGESTTQLEEVGGNNEFESVESWLQNSGDCLTAPPTAVPSTAPTEQPSASPAPSAAPTNAPTAATPAPTYSPTLAPTDAPTDAPTNAPEIDTSGCSVTFALTAGDGRCDNADNIEGCDWDGGDCCYQSCSTSTYVCGVHPGYDCQDPDYEYLYLDSDDPTDPPTLAPTNGERGPWKRE
jgi:hypothetical protein